MLAKVADTSQFFLRVVTGLTLGTIMGGILATALPIYI